MMNWMLFILFLLVPVLLFGTLIEIDVEGGEDFTSIQAGIDSSVSGDTLLVYPGLYQENINYGGRDIVVVSLYYTTGDSCYIENTIIGDVEDGCIVTFENYETRAAILSGFTLRGGTGSNFPDYLSGGVSCLNFSSPTLQNLNIHDNNGGAAGGIYCEYSDPLIENCHIHDSYGHTPMYGGGITLYHSNAEIFGCLIENNSVQVCGGGICVFELSDPLIENTIIRGNDSDGGGGIYAQACNLTMRNVLISDNYSRLGGGIVLYYYVNTDFENVVIRNNECSFYGGAGMYLNTLDCEIEGVEVIGNYGTRNVGVSVNNSEVTLRDFIICNNNVDHENYDGSSMIIDYGSDVIIENSTFQGNISYGTSMIITGSSSLIMRNSIFDDNVLNIQFQASDEGNNNYLDISYCNIVSGESSLDCDEYGSYVWGEGNISEEAGFACINEEDWRLMYYSPCIDAGDPESEYDPDGTISDMGAICYDQENGTYPEINIPEYLHFESGEIIVMDFSEYVYDINPDDLTLSVSGNENVLVDIDDMEVTFSSTDNWSGVEQLVFSINDNSGRLISSDEMAVDVTKDLIYVPEDCEDIQTAIQQACVDSTMIIVAPGIYYENLNFMGKNIDLVSYYETIGDTVYIIETIIDGDCLDAVIRIDSSSVARISGFTIRNGYDNDDRYIGAGINVDYCSTITIENTIIEYNNGHCGGIFVMNSSIELLDLVIRNNNGKSLAMYSNIDIEIDNLEIYNNYEFSGSFIDCYGSGEVIIQNIHYHNNYSDSWSSGLSIVSVDNGIITGINFEENIFDQGYGGLSLTAINSSTLSDITVRNNSAVRFPALNIDTINSTILKNIVIENNEADEFSSGIMMSNCGRIEPIAIVNTLINNNMSSDMSGAIYTSRSTVYFINSSIINNISENGAAIVSTSSSNELNFQNCIIYGNEPAQIQFNVPARSNSIYINHCDVQDGMDGVIQYGSSNLFWEEGNIDADPLFTGIEPYPYDILEYSPCLDAGALDYPVNFEMPEADLAGNPRLSGDGIDMGCYEYQYPGEGGDTEIAMMSDRVWCYPNPFNPELTLVFYTTEDTENAEISIFNIKGQLVKKLKIENVKCKMNSITWDGRDSNGSQVSSGVYFIRFQVGKEMFIRKAVLMK
jgi:Right handed beta helix region/Secretion system C-terminal sorting domain